jgi:predicted Rossmann fold nucleotide-binding protein DprA/Smf involved in DNA uptake
MNMSLSPNAQAILLLTAPLIAGRGTTSVDLLTFTEYKRLARFLHENKRQPADLLAPDADLLIAECSPLIKSDRLKRLLERGFLLSQSIEQWQARAIWVVSRADDNYPVRLKKHLKSDAPPVLYGCGDAAILETGGLAVVGSRHVDDALVNYTESIGRLAAAARCTIVSGGARGIDQAAMRGALEAGGKVTGILADSLERTAINREHRNLLIEGQLALISPYDPSSGFNVGHAMQRNKLIYAFSDAALVVSSDYEKGGTWAGAVEQLEKLRLVPVYVRTPVEASRGLKALKQKGALPWPNPSSPEAFSEVFTVEHTPGKALHGQDELSFAVHEEPGKPYETRTAALPSEPTKLSQTSKSPVSPAEELFAKVKDILERMEIPKTDAEVAEELNVSKSQAKVWLQRLVSEGALQKLSKPVRYQATLSAGSLFRQRR